MHALSADPTLLFTPVASGLRRTASRRVALGGRAWVLCSAVWLGGTPAGAAVPASAPVRAALTVSVVRPQAASWPVQVAAAGNIGAWQEAVVSAEGAGGRLVEVSAQVGDRVKKGQVLARLATDTLRADLAQSRAGVAEAQAILAEATANAQRARDLLPSGVLSTQQAQQALTAELTARARVDALVAKRQADELRLAQADVRAPDDGVIAARQAVIGGFAGPGQELFRLIRRERLEWRAELPSAELARLRPGLAANLVTATGERVSGTVRQLAPTVDASTRMAVVFVDVQPGSSARAGMFARGDIHLGQSQALSLPQAALVLRDGFQYVMQVGSDQRVRAVKVQAGRRQGERVEVLGGLAADAAVVASGGAFLTDGDAVKVVAPAVSSASAPVAR